MIDKIPLVSTFVLGALHSLEPGHGKSLIALQSAQNSKWSDSLSMLASLLFSHFLLVTGLSLLVYYQGDRFSAHWLGIAFPLLVIFYGLFLLIKNRKKKNDYLACSCGTQEEKSGNSPIFIGALAGLTPCPSVFAPIAICMSQQDFGSVFMYLLAYIFGVMAIFVSLLIGVSLFKNRASSLFNQVYSKVNPHVVSGIIMILVGVIYLVIQIQSGGEH